MAKDIADMLPQPEQLEGEKMTKDQLENKILEVTKFAILPSSYEGSTEFAVVQARLSGKFCTFSAGSVIMKKLQTIGLDNLPVSCKLVKVPSKNKGRQYWDLISTKAK
jgi:hypothetical protein